MLFLTRLLTGCPAEARALRGDECGQAAFTVTQCVQGEAFSIGLILLKGLRLESQSSSPGLHRCHVSWLPRSPCVSARCFGAPGLKSVSHTGLVAASRHVVFRVLGAGRRARALHQCVHADGAGRGEGTRPSGEVPAPGLPSDSRAPGK